MVKGVTKGTERSMKGVRGELEDLTEPLNGLGWHELKWAGPQKSGLKSGRNMRVLCFLSYVHDAATGK